MRLLLAPIGGSETGPDTPVEITRTPVLINSYELAPVIEREARRLRRAGVAGQVVVGVVIDEHGLPDMATLEFPGSPAEALRTAAAGLVRRMRFTPATAGARTVRFRVQIPLGFVTR
jgi:TonB family protein